MLLLSNKHSVTVVANLYHPDWLCFIKYLNSLIAALFLNSCRRLIEYASVKHRFMLQSMGQLGQQFLPTNNLLKIFYALCLNKVA